MVEQATGSVLVTAGQTKVLCTVIAQDGVPHWMKGQGKAWLTAEYSMLPASTRVRKPRDGRVGGKIDARSLEIQRLIGRAMRAALDLSVLPEMTFWIDCDVLNADGGTRTTSINGACVALHDALSTLHAKKPFARWPMRQLVQAVSIGLWRDEFLVDLDYREDSGCDVDLNVVRLTDGRLVEVQGTAEGSPFDDDHLLGMLELSKSACAAIRTEQERCLGLEPSSGTGSTGA